MNRQVRTTQCIVTIPIPQVGIQWNLRIMDKSRTFGTQECVLYREVSFSIVSFTQSVLYRRFHCILLKCKGVQEKETNEI